MARQLTHMVQSQISSHFRVQPLRKNIYITWFCLLVITCLSMMDVSAQTASELQSDIALKYQEMESMSASFVQESTSEFLDSPQRFSGTVLFSATKYRIQTASQTIVTDGKTLWIYNKAEKQVILNDFVEDESSFSLTALLRQVGSEYHAELGGRTTNGGVQHNRLVLTPNSDHVQFKQVIIDSRISDHVVTKVEVLDHNDVTMMFSLSDIVINPTFSADSFTFTSPAGVEIIDLRN